MPELKQKEEFMVRNGIQFAYDQYNNMTVFADDGKLLLFPIVE
jgi:hypothetical protein